MASEVLKDRVRGKAWFRVGWKWLQLTQDLSPAEWRHPRYPDQVTSA